MGASACAGVCIPFSCRACFGQPELSREATLRLATCAEHVLTMLCPGCLLSPHAEASAGSSTCIPAFMWGRCAVLVTPSAHLSQQPGHVR